MQIPEPKTAPEQPEAEIPQFMTLVSSPAPHHVALKGNSGIFKPRPYFWQEIRSSTHREQFGESRRPSEAT